MFQKPIKPTPSSIKKLFYVFGNKRQNKDTGKLSSISTTEVVV